MVEMGRRSFPSVTRDTLAAAFRALPRVRGKGPVGAKLSRWLTDVAAEDDCLVTFTMRDGSRMRVDLRSRTEIWAYWTGEYDYDIIRRLATCLTPGCVVFDVGANVGFYTVALARRLQALGGGALYAFEPVPTNFARLQEVVRLNALEDTVHPVNVALGDEEGAISLYMEDTNRASTGNAVLVKGTVGAEVTANTRAAITRLDALARERNIPSCRLIKIDVEGAELMFLRGGASFLRRCRPIIYGEFNAHWMRQFGHSFLDVAELMASWDYRFYQQVGRRARFVPLARPEPGTENVLLAPAELPEDTLRRLGVVRGGAAGGKGAR